MYLLAPFILQNFEKLLRANPPIQCYEDVPFLTQNGPFVLNKIFFGTKHYYYFHLPIGPFHLAKFKKILTVDPEL